MLFVNLLPDAWKEKLRRCAGAVSPRDRLENLQLAGFTPRQIIDAGAYHGDWAITAHKIFPAAALLMIEPQPALAPRLSQLCTEIPNLHFRGALLGAEKSRAKFILEETNSRVVPDSHVATAGEQICELEVETLKDIADQEGFAKCDMLKLDLQGQELQALGGADDLFGQIEVIVTEVSWLSIGNVPLVLEVAEAFRRRNYQLYDVFGLNYRPLDRALWQTDVVFVRRDSALLARESRWK
jgi:FkbM family methyltransferase